MIPSVAQVSLYANFIYKSEMTHIYSYGPMFVSFSSYPQGCQTTKLRIYLHNGQTLTTSAIMPGFRSFIEWKPCISILEHFYYLSPQRPTPCYLRSILSRIKQANIIWNKVLPFDYMYRGVSYHETLKLTWNIRGSNSWICYLAQPRSLYSFPLY